mgnify:CR=1 FL=1
MINTTGYNTLLEQGLSCITMLALGISNAPFIPRDIRLRLTPVIIAVLILALLAYFYLNNKRSKEDIEREERDERNKMILEKSVWYCRQAEDWLLLVLFAILGLYFQKYEVAYTLFWFMIGRFLLTFGIRWWLNRKY